MYNLLIVDDEFWIRKWFDNIFVDDDIYNVVKTCENAEEALMVMKNSHIDIVITDINMPIVSGLEFIKKIKEHNEQIPEFIVISGYDKFEYAKEAIKLEVVGYILKPIDKNELFELLVQAAENIESNRKDDILKTSYVEMKLKNMNAQSEFYFEEKDDVHTALSKIDLKNTPFICGMLVSKTENEMSKSQLRNIFRDIKDFDSVLIFKQDMNTFVFVLIGITENDIGKLHMLMAKRLDTNYHLSFSSEYNDIANIDKAIVELRDNFVLRFAVKPHAINSNHKTRKLHDNYIKGIKDNNRNLILKLGHDTTEFYTNNNYDVEGCLNFFFLLASDVIKSIKSKYKSKSADIDKLVEAGYQCIVENKANYSINLIVKNYEEYFIKVVNKVSEFDHKSIDTVVNEVMNYTKNNYDTDINLGMVSEKFGVNSSYLSKKFKDITGSSFIEFLTSTRIEQAKFMLEGSDAPIKVISKKVGFNEPKYFSKVFQLNVGVKPSDYREMVKNNE